MMARPPHNSGELPLPEAAQLRAQNALFQTMARSHILSALETKQLAYQKQGSGRADVRAQAVHSPIRDEEARDQARGSTGCLISYQGRYFGLTRSVASPSSSLAQGKGHHLNML